MVPQICVGPPAPRKPPSSAATPWNFCLLSASLLREQTKKMSLESSEEERHTIRFASPSHHQEIFYSNTHPSDQDEVVNTSYLLLDLPAELLEPVKKQLEGRKEPEDVDLTMELRGRNDEEIVLTTPQKTFQLRTVQNSNSVMICGTHRSDPESRKLGLTVLKVVHETIQLTDVTCFPGNRLERIKELLQPHFYTGQTNETRRRIEDSNSPDASPPVTLASLSQEVRASDSEIQDYLRQLHVVELDGFLRIISLGYLSTILSALLKCLDELGVGPHERFALGPVVDILTSRSDIHQAALLQILKKFSVDSKIQKFPHDASYDPHESVGLDPQQVVKMIGLSQLLCIKPTKIESSHNPKDHRYIQKTKVENLLADWKAKLPKQYGHYCTIESLSSHSILSNDEKNITVIPMEKLSLEPKTRMRQLFEIQDKWKIHQIEPFLSPITGGGLKKKFDELVLKFCRKIKEPAVSQSNPKSNSDNSSPSETVWLTARNKW